MKSLKTICLLVFAQIHFVGIGNDYEVKIARLVKNNPGQMTYEEYLSVAEILAKKSPCNFLVFGVGNDSQLWLDINQNGYTVFLEDSKQWLDLVLARIPELKGIHVSYGTQIADWKKLLDSQDYNVLLLDLPRFVFDIKWDLIFVDAPRGAIDSKKSPGRMKSIYIAAFLAQKSLNTDVFVHDCHREVERIYCDTFLGEKFFVKQVHHLRHYLVDVLKEEIKNSHVL